MAYSESKVRLLLMIRNALTIFLLSHFLTDKKLAQQGYITSEPFAIEKQSGFKVVVFLLADYVYQTYTTTNY